jgi:hypothetical protein
MNRWATVLIGATVVASWSVAPVHASELAFLQVSQPLFDPNAGVHPYQFTYVTWFGESQPGIEIRFTCAANLVPVQGVPATRNYNVASLLGFKVIVEDRSDSRAWKERPPSHNEPHGARFIDTLGVTLDLSGAIAPDRAFTDRIGREQGVELGGVTLALAVDATIQCILENARESDPSIDRIRLAVAGNSTLAGRSGVFRVGPPRRRP